MIINAEGIGHSDKLAKHIEEATGAEARATILAYLQRGGRPTCTDRVYASIMGSKAVEIIRDGRSNRVVVNKDGEFKDYDILDALAMKKTLPNDFLILSRKLIR